MLVLTCKKTLGVSSWKQYRFQRLRYVIVITLTPTEYFP